MVPQGVRHKKNGHRQPPAPSPTPGDILRDIHSDPADAAGATSDLARFARIAQSERHAALWQELAHQVDGLAKPMAEILDRTRASFARGELADVREALAAFESRARLAAQMVARLAAEARGDAFELVDLNALLADALSPAGDTGGVVSRLDPTLPAVLGHPDRIAEAVLALVRYCGAERDRSGTVVVETSPGPGVLAGEQVVRVTVEASGASARDAALPDVLPVAAAPALAGAGLDDDLRRAAWIVAEHGGVITTSRAGAGVRFTLELAAAGAGGA